MGNSGNVGRRGWRHYVAERPQQYSAATATRNPARVLTARAESMYPEPGGLIRSFTKNIWASASI